MIRSDHSGDQLSVDSIDYSKFSRFPTRDVKHIPGDSGTPVIGDTLRFLQDVHGLARHKFQH